MACGDGCCGSSPSPDLSTSVVAPPSQPSEAASVDNVAEVAKTTTVPDSCQFGGCRSTVGDCCDPVSVAESTDAGGCCKPVSNDQATEGSCCPTEHPDMPPSHLTVDPSCGLKFSVTAKAQDVSCCSGKAKLDSSQVGCCTEGEPETKRSVSRCDEEAIVKTNSKTCCPPEPVSKLQDCSPTNAVSESVDERDAPDCCKGKTSPCCDEECIERIALRDCQSSAQGSFWIIIVYLRNTDSC